MSLCFRRGTRIRTPRGETPVERLQRADLVVTRSGGLRSVRWIRQRSYSRGVVAGRADLLPIRFHQGALGDALPCRDLWLAPSQGLYLDGLLIPACALVNGKSILQVDAVDDEVSFFQLGLDVHDLIYAEGALTDSAQDPADAAAEHTDDETDFDAPARTASAPVCAPRAHEGPGLTAVRARLAALATGLTTSDEIDAGACGHLDRVDRAEIVGWVHVHAHADGPTRLRILDNGALLGEALVGEAWTSSAPTPAAVTGVHRRGFSYGIPGGLSPERRHFIEVRRADDDRALSGSPVVIEAVNMAAGALARTDPPAAWRGSLDSATRHMIEGWARDEAAPQEPVALLIMDNGAVIARILANRYRDDLEKAGLGDGRHGFSAILPGGLSALSSHVIQVLGENDGWELAGSPITIPAANTFDAALEHALSAAVAAITLPADRERALTFLAAQTERLLQAAADAAAGREARHIRRQLERRWGRSGAPFEAPDVAALKPRALVIDDLLPAIGRDAGSNAILSHMRTLKSLGYEVSFVAADELSPPADACAALESEDIACCRAPYYASVEEVLRRQREGFELIYLHRISNASKYLMLARRLSPRARIVYSVADLHHIRLARQAKVEERPELMGYSKRLRLMESMAASFANVIITHSAFEADWLAEAIPGCNVHVVPWSVPLQPTLRPWNERQGIAFVGNFGHMPNLDAARFLAERVMPRVRAENPSIECLLVGSHMPESIKRLAAPGILVLGQVADLAAVYRRVRLVAAPLRFGAGVKGKVLESLAAGVPCVMSPLAAEGIALPKAYANAIAQDAAHMAATILRLHADEAECRILVESGLTFMATGYAEEAVVNALRAAVEGRRAPSRPDVAPGRVHAAKNQRFAPPRLT